MMKAIAALFLALALPGFAQAPATPPAPAANLKAQLSKTPLASVIIPEVVFDQAPVDDAIAALTALVETHSKGALKLQWIDVGFDRKKWPTPVTLTAKNFSAGKLLNEILAQAGLEAKLEVHAIVLSPKTRVVERRVIPAEKSEAPKVESGPNAREGFKSPLKNR
jgi:hypothetical protein